MERNRIRMTMILLLAGMFGVVFWLRDEGGAPQEPQQSAANGIHLSQLSAPAKPVPQNKSWPLIAINPTKNLSDSLIENTRKIQNFFLKKEVFLSKFQSGSSLSQNTVLADQGGNVSQMTDNQIFEKVWPQSYRSDLKQIEDIMVKDGFVQGNARNAMANDTDMLNFYRTLLEYMRSKAMIDNAKYDQFLHGINEVFPDILGKEKEGLRVRGDFRAALPKDQHFAAHKTPADTMHALLDGLAYVFSFAEPANAMWVTGLGGDCYKDDAPWYPVPGPNLMAFCCNCGLACTPTCHPVPDCGPQGLLCVIPMGCLNLVCRAWPNAIWDPTTSICGCG